MTELIERALKSNFINSGDMAFEQDVIKNTLMLKEGLHVEDKENYENLHKLQMSRSHYIRKFRLVENYIKLHR